MNGPLPSLSPEYTGQPSKKNGLWLFVVIGALLFILGILFWGPRDGKELESLQAQIDGRTLDLRAPMSGVIRNVGVREGQDLEQGQAVLDYDDSRLRLDYLEAQAGYQAVLQGHNPGLPYAAQLNRTLEEIGLEIQRLRQIEEAAQQDVERWATAQAKALLALRTPGATAAAQAQAVLDEADSSRQLAQARQQHENTVHSRQQAEIRLQGLQQTGSAVFGSELAQLWLARFQQAEQALLAASMVMPETGRVVRMNVQTGSQTSYGDVVLTYMPKGFAQENYWVTAVFSAEDLAELRSGLPCRVETDGFDCKGRISGISIEQDYVLVRIQLDSGPDGDKLHVGQLAEVFVTLS